MAYLKLSSDSQFIGTANKLTKGLSGNKKLRRECHQRCFLCQIQRQLGYPHPWTGTNETDWRVARYGRAGNLRR